MKALRLLGFLCVLFFFGSTFAFAGVPLVVDDPQCDGTEQLQLGRDGTATFVVTDPTQIISVCNASGQNFSNLNFTIAFAQTVNLGEIYCGGPNTGEGAPPAAFSSCDVLDPTKAVGSDLVHEFTVANGDTPSNFYGDNSCAIGCGDGVPNDPGTLVHLSFNLAPILTFEESIPGCDQAETGLVNGCRFNLDFNCPSLDGSVVPCNTQLAAGSLVSFKASNTINNPNFPSVPEPASLLLTTTALLPVFIRRVRKGFRS
jgi:hypothetical protein